MKVHRYIKLFGGCSTVHKTSLPFYEYQCGIKGSIAIQELPRIFKMCTPGKVFVEITKIGAIYLISYSYSRRTIYD